MEVNEDTLNIIWNYDDIDMDILKVYDHDILIGYFRIDMNTFNFAARKVHTLLLRTIINQYDKAKNEADLIKEQ